MKTGKLAPRSGPALLKVIALLVAVVFMLPVRPAYAATFSVTKVADTNDGTCDADCSLREAIAAAEAAGGADIITLPAGTYTLTLGSELLITTDITINGAGAGTTIIEANAAANTATYRVLRNNGGTVILNGVTIRHGVCGNCVSLSNGGGGIYNQGGTLTLDSSTVSDNSASAGGGIFNQATLSIQNGSLIGGAGAGNSVTDAGGGILNTGTTTIDASTVSANISTNRGGGIYNSGTLDILNGSLIGGAGAANSANQGGGVDNARGTTTIDASTVSANTANFGGGGILNNGTLNIQNGSLIGGVGAANSAGFGGGVHNFSGTTTIDASTVSANTATSDGGGILNNATLNILNGSLIGGAGAANSANSGGGVYNFSGTTTIDASTVSANTATISGGGYYRFGGTSIVTNSCIFDNSDTAVYNDNETEQTFTGNWWGAADGPGPIGPGSGDTVSVNIDFSGFLTAEAPICAPPPPPAAPVVEPTAVPGPVVFDPAISKAGFPENATVGEAVIWTIVVTNPGTEPINDVLVQDAVPSQFDIVSATATQGTVDVSGQSITANLGTLLGSGTATITINTVANETALPGSVCNTASVGAAASVDCVTIFPDALPPTGGPSPLMATLYTVLPLLALLGLVGAGGYAFLRRRSLH